MGSEKKANVFNYCDGGDDAKAISRHMDLISAAVSGKMGDKEYKAAMEQAEVVSKYNTVEPYIIILGVLIGAFCAFNNSFPIIAAISEAWACAGTVVVVAGFECLKILANLFLRSLIKDFQRQCSATKVAIDKMSSRLLLGLRKYHGYGAKDTLPAEKSISNGPFRGCGNVIEIKSYPEQSQTNDQDDDFTVKKITQYFSVPLGNRAGGIETWLRVGKTQIVPKNGTTLRADVKGKTYDVDDVHSDTITHILDSPPADFNVPPKQLSYCFTNTKDAFAVVDGISSEKTNTILAHSVGRGLRKVLKQAAPSSKKK